MNRGENTLGRRQYRMAWTLRNAAIILSGLFVISCSSIQMASDKVKELTLGAIGVKSPEKPDIALPPRSVAIKLMTAQNLNAGDDGKGLSVIFKLYKLKNQTAFMNTPYSTFGNPDKEKEAMGDTIVETKELTLTPGETIDLKESVAREAGYIGVIALFRTPSQYRWRFAFVSADASVSGITIGVHRCAMTATSIPPIGMDLSESALLSPTKCQAI